SVRRRTRHRLSPSTHSSSLSRLAPPPRSKLLTSRSPPSLGRSSTATSASTSNTARRATHPPWEHRPGCGRARRSARRHPHRRDSGFPVHGRTVYEANLFVGDQLLSESPMRTHPLTPMPDSNLVRLLGQQT